MLLYCFLQHTMHMRGGKRKLTEVNLGQHFLKCLGDLGMFHFASRHLQFPCSWYNLPKHLPHFRKLPSPDAFFVSSVSRSGGFLQRGHDKKATYHHESKYCPVRTYPFPRENKAKPIPCYIKSTTSRHEKFSFLSIQFHLEAHLWFWNPGSQRGY